MRVNSRLVFVSFYSILSISFVYCVCRDGTIRCPSGDVCTTLDSFCDGFADCPDAYDESNCESKKMKFFLKRFARAAVSELKLTGEVKEKMELFADSPEITCPPGLFECSKGCARNFIECEAHHGCDYELMDGTFNCPKECGPDEFRCSAYYCISKAKVCNGYINCYNRLDELECERNKTIELRPIVATRYQMYKKVNAMRPRGGARSLSLEDIEKDFIQAIEQIMSKRNFTRRSDV